MKVLRTLRAPLALSLLALLALPSAAQERLPSMSRVESLLRSRRYGKAEEALVQITRADPNHGEAWFQLANARHQLKDWKGAANAGRRAAEFGAYRSTALYNLACALSLGGELEEARDALLQSTLAGFLDFDLMESDADLKSLRAKFALPMPPAHTQREKRARNGLRMPYAVLEPAGFNPEKTYPVLVALAPGGPRSLDWMLAELWSDVNEQERWIVVCIAAPAKKGWFTHPTHHALEDVLKDLKKEYRVEGDAFHLFGIASGCSPASTYSGMSAKYFQTMTLVSSSAWTSYDESDWKRWRGMPVLQLVGSESHTLELDEKTHASMQKSGVPATLIVVPGDGVLLESVRGVALLAEIDEVHRPD